MNDGGTVAGAVGVVFVAVVATVIVSVAFPVVGDAAAAVAFKLRAGAGVSTADLVTVITTVII